MIGDPTIWRLVRRLSVMSCSLRSPSKIESLVRAYHPDLLPAYTLGTEEFGWAQISGYATYLLSCKLTLLKKQSPYE